MYCSSYSAPRSQATAVSSSTAASKSEQDGPIAHSRVHRKLVSLRSIAAGCERLVTVCCSRCALRCCWPRAGEPAAALRRGINITNWFRFPPSRDPAALRALSRRRRAGGAAAAGFTFVRLPVQPELLAAPERARRRGRPAASGTDWRWSWRCSRRTGTGDRAGRSRLLATWRSLAPLLRRFDPRRHFPGGAERAGVRQAIPAAWAAAAAPGRAGDPRRVCPRIRSCSPGPTGAASPACCTAAGTRSQRDLQLSSVRAGRADRPRRLSPDSMLTRWRVCRSRRGSGRLRGRRRRDARSADRGPDALLLRAALGRGEAHGADRRGGCMGTTHHVPCWPGNSAPAQRLNAPARLAWLTAVREACERRRIGWALWGYDDSMGFGLRPPGGSAPARSGVLRALGLTRSSSREESPARAPIADRAVTGSSNSAKRKAPGHRPGASKQGGFTSGRRRGHRPPSDSEGPEHWRRPPPYSVTIL